MKLFRISTVPISLNILLKGQLRDLQRFYDVTAISGAGNELDEVEKREGIKVFPIAMQRQISPLKDLVSLWKLYRYFKKEKPDIVHSITPKAGMLSMVAAKWAGVPVRMHTFTGLIFPYRTGMMQKLLIAIDRLLCSHATHIYPEGKGVREDLLKYRITNKPLKIIADGNVNGIDLQYFNPAALSLKERQKLRLELGIGDTDFVFVFVGRLVGDKGINELVTAFKNIASAPLIHRDSAVVSDCDSTTLITHDPVGMSGVKLLLVGPLEHAFDPLLAQTQTEIDSNPHVISMGYQQDVRPYFAISDALVFPSYREGFPNVVLQAGAMELPAIVTEINGCNEIIEEGKNGLIIPVKDAAALQQAMEKLATDGTLYHKLRENARPMIDSRYRQEVVWQALLEEYEQVSRGR